jgi:S1 RNA binding domain protein
MAYSVGETVNGIVTSVTDYGAFVRMEDGSVGMIHISKLSHGFVSDIHSVVKKGDALSATVIANENGKIALSLIGKPPKQQETRSRGFKNATDFESMLSSFKSASDEKLAMLNRDKKRKR